MTRLPSAVLESIPSIPYFLKATIFEDAWAKFTTEMNSNDTGNKSECGEDSEEKQEVSPRGAKSSKDNAKNSKGDDDEKSAGKHGEKGSGKRRSERLKRKKQAVKTAKQKQLTKASKEKKPGKEKATKDVRSGAGKKKKREHLALPLSPQIRTQDTVEALQDVERLSMHEYHTEIWRMLFKEWPARGICMWRPGNSIAAATGLQMGLHVLQWCYNETHAEVMNWMLDSLLIQYLQTHDASIRKRTKKALVGEDASSDEADNVEKPPKKLKAQVKTKGVKKDKEENLYGTLVTLGGVRPHACAESGD